MRHQEVRENIKKLEKYEKEKEIQRLDALQQEKRLQVYLENRKKQASSTAATAGGTSLQDQNQSRSHSLVYLKKDKS